ncbi:MAG: S1 RNA-binding domain-containing protein [Chloroflexota bacterium]
MSNDHPGYGAFEDQEDDAQTQPAESHSPQEQNGSLEEMGMEALLRESEYSFRSLKRGETLEGTIVRVDPDEVLVDVGMKSEGVIPARELDTEDPEPLHIGDRTLVYVVQPENSEGHAILSLRRARLERSWRDIDDLYRRGAVIEGPVVDFNKGGLIVDVKGVRGFVPVSQVLDLRSVTRQDGESEEITQTLSAMQGRRLPLKIIEINRSRNRLILSERAAVQERRTQLKDELMDQLQPGQVRHGVVSNLTSFGAFIDLGGADGLVHVSELSYNRVNHPNEILRVGQEVDVAVLTVDRDTKKIALSLKRAQPDPWSTVEERYRVGQVVGAVITKIAKFGAFAKVEEGLEGLIHLSELTDLAVQDPSQVVNEGNAVNVKIIHINSQRRRLGLSVRQAVEPPQQDQSFGEVDSPSPFAVENFGAYVPGASSEVAGDIQPPQELESASPEADASALEQTPAEGAPAEPVLAQQSDEGAGRPTDTAVEAEVTATEIEAASDSNQGPVEFEVGAPVADTEVPEGDISREADPEVQRFTAGDQQNGVTEFEPADTEDDSEQPPASVPEEASPASAEAMSTDQEDEQPETASAAPKRAGAK